MEWWKQKYLLVKIFLKYVYLKCLQQLYQTVRHVRRNHYEIQYILHDNVYKIQTKVKRGPSNIERIMDHQNNNITEEVRSYLGPNEDFHGQLIRPFDLGYEKLHVEFRNGDESSFETNDLIVFD